MRFTGALVVLGDEVSTDLLFPSEAILTIAPYHPDDPRYRSHLREYGLRNLDVDAAALERASILVAGHGLGAGSSRQYAVEVLKAHGIQGVVAESIHPIFFRNLWNLGMFALEIEGISSTVRTGDHLSIDLVSGVVSHRESGRDFSLPSGLPAWLRQLLEAGGLLPFWQAQDDEAAGEAPEE